MAASSFESQKAKELSNLLEELMSRSGESEHSSVLDTKIFQLLTVIKQHYSESGGRAVTSPFFGYKENDLFRNLVQLMDCYCKSFDHHNTTMNVKRLVVEIMGKITVSFDPTIPILYHYSLCDLLWGVLESAQSVEAEELALVATRIFCELYKENGSLVMMDAEMSTRLHKFVLFLRQMYVGAESVFDLSTTMATTTTTSSNVGRLFGVKLLKESPNITQALVHAFPGSAETFLSNLIGDMISLLNFGDTTRISPDMLNDLFDIQVRTLGLIGSFLSRLRSGEIVKPFDQAIAKVCVRLLKSIPVDNIYIRRELILGIRAYIQHSPDAAGYFVPYIDDLFDDAIVVGIGKSAYDILRPVVVSTLADLANVIVRSPMHIPQGDKLKRIFAYFCAAMSDSDLPISSQFTSARIILNIIDQLYNRAGGRGASVKNKVAGGSNTPQPPVVAPVEASGEILRDVLRSMVEKFSSLILFMPRVIALITKKLELESEYPIVATLSIGELDESSLLSHLIGKPSVPVGIPVTDVLIEGVREVRSLIRTLLLSVKMILHCLTHRSSTAPHRSLTKSDMSLVESMFEDSLKVSHLFSIAAGLVQSTGFDPVNINASSNGNGRFSSPRELAIACSVQEERDLLEQIASVLQILPPVSLVDLLAKRIGWLIANIQTNNQLMTLANVLIQHPQCIQSVCEVVFGYISLKNESLILMGDQGQGQQVCRPRQFIIDSLDIDPACPGFKVADFPDYSCWDIGTNAARLLPHTFFPSNQIGDTTNSTCYSLGYHEGEVDGTVTSALVAHVMPSLDSRLRVYADLVNTFGLREPTTKSIDKRDVVITLLKTLSRQVSTSAPPPMTPNFLEPIIRPFVPEIVTSCLRIARSFPEEYSIYSAVILRYTFRLMGSGIKTSSSIRELSDSLPLFIETCVQMWRYFEGDGKSKFMQSIWLEIALTLPVRLKTLVPNFEQVMNVMVMALVSDNCDTVAVALTVLESWVDGLTPDFLFPLIPGHANVSLSSALLGLTKPPQGHVVHTTVSGNNSVRATKILGKLGARSKFTLKSNNVVGHTGGEVFNTITKFPLAIGDRENHVAIEFDVSEAVHVGLKILAKHSLVSEVFPVSVGESDETTATSVLVPEQELLDSFNIVMTSYIAHRAAAQNVDFLRTLGKGLIDGCACVDATVAERSRAAVNDVLVTDVQQCFEADKKSVVVSDLPGIVYAAIDSLRGDKLSSRRLDTSVSLIIAFLEEYIRILGKAHIVPQTLLRLVKKVSEQLVSSDWSDQIGASICLRSIFQSVPASMWTEELVLPLFKNLISGYTLAEGTSASIPSLKAQRSIAETAVMMVRTVLSKSKFSGDRDVKPQETQIQWLSSNCSWFASIVSLCVSEFCVENKTLAEFCIHVIADTISVSVSALVCWVDERMDAFVEGLKNAKSPGGHGNHPVFKIASFVLQLRPAPVIAADGGEKLHVALLASINRAVEWLEREDDLAIIYGFVSPLPGTGPVPPGVAPHQHQSYLMQRGVLRRCLLNWTDQNTKILQAVRVAKLTLLHTQLGASSQPTTLPGYLTPGSPAPPTVGGEMTINHPTWHLEDRIIITLCRMLFSFDSEAVAAAAYSISAILGVGIKISDQVWKQSLLMLAREIASRAPIAMNEIQGLSRLVHLLPVDIDDSIRVDLAERLFERMHTYLGVLRERTFAPIQQAIVQSNVPGNIPIPGSSVPVISWRAGVHSDSVVNLAAQTLACFSGLVCDRLPLTERLLVLATQLDSALPATHGMGQLTSPFLAPLVASLCIDPERTADQLLTKMEIHKVFGFVAELVSLKACLGLRKALQDRCHQMSSTETTGVLMMRTPAASLISVLARNDPSFLWLQYVSSATMMKTMTSIRSVSLVESIVRNWETAVASLTSTAGATTPSAVCICPGGVLGPMDMTNSVTGYEGRIIAWTVMQFIRAPIAVSPAVVEDIDSHLNVRVRLLIRLATCLSLRTMIDVSPIRDWFVTEAAQLTTDNEKIEIVSKAIEAFQDSSISAGCKYALLKYLVVPQIANVANMFSMEKLVNILLNIHSHTALVDEAVRVEIVKLCGILIRSGSAAASAATQFLLSNLSMDRYLTRQWTQSLLLDLIATDHLPANVLHTLLRSMVVDDSIRRRAVSYDMRNAHVFSLLGSKISSVVQSDTELVAAIVARLQGARDLSSSNLGLWRWFILIARAASAASSIPSSLMRVCVAAISKSKLSAPSATTDMRMIGLELLSLVGQWSVQLKDKNSAQFVLDTILRLVVVGPEPSGPASSSSTAPNANQPSGGAPGPQPSSAVSPTLISEFLNKCLGTFVSCMENFSDLKLELTVVDQSCLMLPKQPHSVSPVSANSAPSVVSMETIRHCRSLVCLNRVATEYYRLSSSIAPSGHLMRLIGLGMISTDKSVCQTLCLLIETLISSGKFGMDSEFVRFVVSGISAGLAVASNKTSGRIRVNPLNPNSPTFSVTPYMGIALCIAVLRGLVRSGQSTNDSIGWLQSTLKDALVHALTQGTRSFVFSLLPQHLHQYPLTGTKWSPPPLDPSLPTEPMSVSGFAYPGTLQGPDFVVPTLLHTFRLCQLILTKEDDLAVFRNTVMWLIECLGPFLTFATPNHQTFSHLLNALNFTIPQQPAQKPGSSNGAHTPGGLASVFSIVQLTALVRFLVVDIVASWCHIRRGEQGTSDRIDESFSPPALVLSLSTSLVGDEALRSICDLSILQVGSPRKSPAIDSRAIDCLVHVIECMDGLSILSSQSDPSVKRLLGFVPRRAVTCFPGSVLSTSDTHGWLGSNVAGLWSSRSCFGGLFGVAVDVLIDAMVKINQQEYWRLLPAILIVSGSGEQILRNQFGPILQSFVPTSSLEDRMEWILKECPWDKLAGRCFLPVFASLLLVGCDDRVWVSEERSTTSPKKPAAALSLVSSAHHPDKCLSAQWEWIRSVQSLGQVDVGIAYLIVEKLLGSILDLLGPEKSHKLLNQFISSSSLSRQSLFSKNVIGAVLASTNCSLSVPVLVHCARHHGLYFEVLDILESMDDGENFEVVSAIQSLYKDLNDKDSWLGSILLRGCEKQTNVAISYLQQNRTREAREVLEHSMNSLSEDDQSTIAPLWMEANKSLSQWTNLLDVVGEVKDPELKLDIFGNTNEWGQVAELMAQYDWSVKSWSKLYAAYLALSFSDSCHSGSDAAVKQKVFLADMEASLNRSYHNLVASWNLVGNNSTDDESLLLCQEFIEFGESANLVTEIRAAITGAKPSYPTPKQLLNTWRDRLPDKCDSVTNWCEVLNLRMIIFRHIQTQCAADVVAASHIAPYLHDLPWSLVKLANMASKNGYSEMAQSALQRFQSSITRTTTDAFNQEFFEALREQIRIYRISDKETDWRIGLNVLNSCVISNTNAQQASEISLMQGRLLAQLGRFEEAKTSLQMSVNLYPMIASGWCNLGDVMFQTTNGNSEECLMAYMQSVSLRSSKATRLIPRMLLMVQKYGLKSLAEKCTDSQPSSVWIFWVPILVSALHNSSLASTAKALLKKLATTLPQSVFFALQDGSVSEQDKVEILGQIKDVNSLESFRSQILDAFGGFDSQQLNAWIVGESLNDLRAKRVTVNELKTRLAGIVKGEPTDTALTKWLEKTGNTISSNHGSYESVTDKLDMARFVSSMCGTIEMLGNYTRFISVPNGSPLESMSSVQIVGMDKRYRMEADRRGFRFPVVTLVGSNGLRYCYAVRPCFGADDRSLSSQVFAMCNSLMANYSQTKQRGLEIKTLQCVYLSSGIVLEESVLCAPSFEKILATKFHSDDIVEAMVAEFDKIEAKSGEKAAMEAMSNLTPDNVLMAHMRSESCADMYSSSKRFSRAMGALSMIDYIVGIAATKRSLNELCLSRDSGDVFVTMTALKARMGDSSVPFRLTRNLQALIGERNMVGSLPATMRAVADCVDRKSTRFMEFLDVIGLLSNQSDLSVNARSRLGAIVDRAEGMVDTQNLVETIIELISESVDPSKLAKIQPRQFLSWY